MNTPSYTLSLTKSEEKIAQLLTRDAWVFFSSMISHRDLFHVKEIPMMPRGGHFEITNDAEIIQYYVDYTESYTQELLLLGWEQAEIDASTASFAAKLEDATGVQRGLGMVSVSGQ